MGRGGQVALALARVAARLTLVEHRSGPRRWSLRAASLGNLLALRALSGVVSLTEMEVGPCIMCSVWNIGRWSLRTNRGLRFGRLRPTAICQLRTFVQSRSPNGGLRLVRVSYAGFERACDAVNRISSFLWCFRCHFGGWELTTWFFLALF